MNHGSFGSCPEPVVSEQDKWRRLWLEQPDDFYYNHLERQLAAARSAVAERVNCKDVEELVLVDNATTAAVMVAQAMAESITSGRWAPGDAVLLSTFTYGAVRKVFEHYVVPAGGRILDVHLPFPVEDDASVLAAYEAALQLAAAHSPAAARVCLAVVDHVSSMPSYVLPVAEIAALLRRGGVDEIFVDGAHAIGNVEVDVAAVGADYYTSNLHKWGFAPTAAAFVHCRPGRLGRLHHPIPSWLSGRGLARECSWVGTRDFSPLLAAPAGLRFADAVCGARGEGALRAANAERVLAMAAMLASSWADLMPASPPGGGDSVGTRPMQENGLEYGKRGIGELSLQGLGCAGDGGGAEGGRQRLHAIGSAGGPRRGAGLGAPAHMCSAMAMVALPPGVGVRSDAGALALRARLRGEFRVEVPIYFCPEAAGGGAPRQRAEADGEEVDAGAGLRVTAFARLSHQVYNTESDFWVLRDAIRAICSGQPAANGARSDGRKVAEDVEKAVE